MLLPFFAGILLLVVQTTFLPLFPIHRIRPDLLFIFTLSMAFLFPPISGGILAFSMGYLTDLFSGNTLGFYALSRSLLFFALHFSKDRVYLEGFFSQFLFAFLFAIFEGVFILILMNTLQHVTLSKLPPLFFTILLPQSFSTGLLTPLFFLLFKKGALLLFRQPEKGITERG